MVRVLLTLLLLCAASAAEAANFHVSKTGNDNNTCAQAQQVDGQGNPTAPKLTFSGTNGVGKCTITAGDEIRVGAGVYNENFWLNDSGGAPNVGGIGSGTSWTNKIWIRGWPAGTVWTLRPLADNGNRPWCLAVGINRAFIEFDYVYVDGDFCTSPVTTGWGAHHIRFNHCEISGNTSVPFALIQFNDHGAGFHEITRCEIHHGGTNEGLSHGIYSADDNVLMEDNDIHNFSACGIHVYSGSGPTAGSNTARRNKVHNNLQLSGSRRGCGILYASSAPSGLIVNNVIWDIFPSNSGQSSNSGCLVIGSSSATVINNTCYNPATYCVQFDSGATNLTVRNNVCAATPTVRLIGPGGASFASETNNYGTPVSAGGWTNADPLLVNPGADDFRLQSGSPARNNGATLTQATPDIVGTVRPQGGAYDPGAYEFIEGNTAPIITITGPTSDANYFTEFANLGPPFAPLSGTASDNLAVVTCSWSNSRGGAGSCEGLETWFVPVIVLQPDKNVLTVTACDAGLLCTDAVLTVFYQIQRYSLPFWLGRLVEVPQWLVSYGH